MTRAQIATEASSQSDGEERMLRGTCECGEVRYRVADAFRYAANCNCSRCSLADAPGIRPTAHMFVGSKAPWFEITDNLAQYEEYAT